MQALREQPADLVLMDSPLSGAEATDATPRLRPAVEKRVHPPQLINRVLLARGFEPAEPALPEPAPVALSEAALRIAGARVLVVDDNVINQQVAREVLM